MASFSGADMRCPTCNQYAPDRCTCNGPSKEQQIIAGITVTLDASSLYSKWGFSDGDLLSGAFWAMKISGVRRHDVLAQLVEDRLLPALPHPVQTYRVDTAHNPIRVIDEHHEDNSLMFNQRCSVAVTYGEIAALAERMERAAGEGRTVFAHEQQRRTSRLRAALAAPTSASAQPADQN